MKASHSQHHKESAMSRSDSLAQWIDTVSSQMPHLSRAHARVLAYWSYGMVVAQSCGLTTVAGVLSLLLGQSPQTLRQRLREWCYAASEKKGPKRKEVPVAACFGALLRWVLSWWPAQERRLVLALDATTLGQRFTVLAISVVYRGCAIPVAWTVVVATEKGAWRPHWEGLIRLLEGSVPVDWGRAVFVRCVAWSPRSVCPGPDAWSALRHRRHAWSVRCSPAGVPAIV